MLFPTRFSKVHFSSPPRSQESKGMPPRGRHLQTTLNSDKSRAMTFIGIPRSNISALACDRLHCLLNINYLFITGLDMGKDVGSLTAPVSRGRCSRAACHCPWCCFTWAGAAAFITQQAQASSPLPALCLVQAALESGLGGREDISPHDKVARGKGDGNSAPVLRCRELDLS